MNEKEILEYNKRCAEFLGGSLHKMQPPLNPQWFDLPFSKRGIPEGLLKFHSDWNWIMEVVETIENKLNDSFNVDIVNKNQCEIVRNGEEFICGAGFDTINHRKKEAVVDAINQFLIWYEQNK